MSSGFLSNEKTFSHSLTRTTTTIFHVINTSPINSFVVHSRMRISIPISINQDGLSELALCEASFLKSCNYTKRPSLLFLFFAKQIFFRENKGHKEHKQQPLTKYMKNKKLEEDLKCCFEKRNFYIYWVSWQLIDVND